MRRFLVPVFIGFNTLFLGAAEPEKPAEEAPKETPPVVVASVVRESSVTIDGKKIPYKVTTGKLQLKQDDGKARASIFHVSYERTDTKDVSTRPVMFAFNGGPGSSAVWLHIGVLGPKILKLPGDGTQAPFPPARVAENPLSILDVCDLVFVDPVSTGYSRAEKDAKPGDFHGVDGDIESVGDFIRRWISEHDRWASPKYILGESYGGIRVAGLSSHLQSRYGMSLNGVVLLSSLLDFATLQPAQGNDLAYIVYLPSLTGVAYFHKKIQGDRDKLIKESTDFAFGDYAAALLKGVDLDDATRTKVAAKLAGLTGIDADTWLAHDLRLDSTFFRAELLRKEGKVIGRFDGRVAWGTTDKAGAFPDYDPSYSLAYGAFSTAMLDYLGRDLGYKEDQPYEILTGKVQPWQWNANNEIVNLSDRLASAMRDNPHLRVLVMGGRTDLATPPAGVAFSVRHMLNLPEDVRKNISSTFFDGGHMFYLNPPDLIKCRTDLVDFIQAGKP
ncbi:MAG: peptidase S10 [Luteolibacter sp.]|uniref:S10 family peptidase n=1 Tax=Luteolibacter sp. TaxID=1962973 RepID=UPI003266C57A